jgi:hypothetical protein
MIPGSVVAVSQRNVKELIKAQIFATSQNAFVPPPSSLGKTTANHTTDGTNMSKLLILKVDKSATRGTARGEM